MTPPIPHPRRSTQPSPKRLTVLAALRRHAPLALQTLPLDERQRHVLHRILLCRTPALGAQVSRCGGCGWRGLRFHSCRDRHCPTCQGAATEAWTRATEARLLPIPHFQVVFTLPARLRPLAFANPAFVYAAMMTTAAAVLQEQAQQRMAVCLGITAVLHTWIRTLTYHPHVHLLVTSGGMDADDTRWVHTRKRYLFPQKVLGARFQTRMRARLLRALAEGDLTPPPGMSAAELAAILERRARRGWHVDVEPPKGRSARHAARYLARYVKRVALSDPRIVAVTDTEVQFRARGEVVTVTGVEFVRRFLLHVLPWGFRKVRHYGLYAPANVPNRLPRARALLTPDEGAVPEPESPETTRSDAEPTDSADTCPACGWRGLRWMEVGTPMPTSLVAHTREARGPP